MKKKPRSLCRCGCGNQVKRPSSIYIYGHSNIGRIKQGYHISEESIIKMKLTKSKHLYKHSDDSKKKISLGNKGKKRTPEQCLAMSVVRKGRKLSEEHKMKCSMALKGHLTSDETRRKISECRKGHVVSEETRYKISIGNTGKIRSEETHKKLCIARKGHTQQPHSEETKQKIRQRRVEYLSSNVNQKFDTYIEKQIENGLILGNINYRKQIGLLTRTVCDFFIEPNIAIYCDGTYWHNLPGRREKDEEINDKLREQGYIVIRLKGTEIRNNFSKCMSTILERISNVMVS